MGLSDLNPVKVLADGVAGVVNNVLDKLFPDPIERAKAELATRQLDMQPLLNQLAINLQEAASPRLWVSGWRPAIGWVCAAAFGYHFIGQQLLIFLAVLGGYQDIAAKLPAIDWTELSAILLGMLGLSRDRRLEKIEKVAAK